VIRDRDQAKDTAQAGGKCGKSAQFFTMGKVFTTVKKKPPEKAGMIVLIRASGLKSEAGSRYASCNGRVEFTLPACANQG